MTSAFYNRIADNTGIKRWHTDHLLIPVLALVVFLIGQWPLLTIWWTKYWNNMDGYYSHGMLVPILALCMAWANKPRLTCIDTKGSWAGVALILACVPVYVLGMLVKVQLLCGIAFLLTVYGLAIVFLGWAKTKVLFIPILFLSTMIPFADYVLDVLTLRYQVISTTLAARSLSLLGHPIEQQGNTILSSGLPEPLQVGIPCSGLKLLITLIACCWFLTYMAECNWRKKLLVMVMSLPLSVLCNTFRIVMIALVGFYTYSASSVKSFHDWSGMIALLVCSFIVYVMMRILGMTNLKGMNTEPESYKITMQDLCPPHRSTLIGLTSVVILAVSGVLGWAANSAFNMPRGSLNRAYVPDSVGSWVGKDMNIDEKTSNLLSSGDLLSRIYTDPGNPYRPVHVFVTASRSTVAFHDPLMCLTGEGSVFQKDRAVRLDVGSKTPPVNARILEISQGDKSLLIVYWYADTSNSWSDTSKVQVLMKRRMLQDAAHIVMNPLKLSEIKREASARQYIWFRFVLEGTGSEDDMRYLKGFIRSFVAQTGALGEHAIGHPVVVGAR